MNDPHLGKDTHLFLNLKRLILVWNHLGDALLWLMSAQTNAHWRGKFNRSTHSSMQHNLGKLQLIVWENNICSCVVGFYTLSNKYFETYFRQTMISSSFGQLSRLPYHDKLFIFCWQCSRIKVTIVSNKILFQYQCWMVHKKNSQTRKYSTHVSRLLVNYLSLLVVVFSRKVKTFWGPKITGKGSHGLSDIDLSLILLHSTHYFSRPLPVPSSSMTSTATSTLARRTPMKWSRMSSTQSSLSTVASLRISNTPQIWRLPRLRATSTKRHPLISPGLATFSINFCLLFGYKQKMICLEGISMTPPPNYPGKYSFVLNSSSKGPQPYLMHCFQNFIETRTL